MCGIPFKAASVNDLDKYLSSVAIREDYVVGGGPEAESSLVC